MVLVFSLPFCLLLPDGDYHIALNESEKITLNLTKVIPNIIDERLPYRNFSKKELDHIKTIKIFIPNRYESIEISPRDLSQITDYGIVIHYIDNKDRKVIPELDYEDIDLDEDNTIDKKNSLKYPSEFINDTKQMHTVIGRQIIINGEISKDKIGRYRYTKVKVQHDNDTETDELFKKSIKAVNILIDQYRVWTLNYWIQRVRENDVFIYQNIDNNSFDKSFSIQGYTRYKKDIDNDIVKLMQNNLVDFIQPLPFQILRAEAQNAFDSENYFLSIIYSITSLESVLNLFLKIYFKKNRTTNKLRKDIMSVGLFKLVTEQLRPLVKSTTLTLDLLNKLGNAIRIRNDIIHNSNLKIPRETANQTIVNVTKLTIILVEDSEMFNNLDT